MMLSLDSRATRRLSAFAVFLSLLALLALRLRFASEPLDRDLATYLLIAREWLEGRELYSELWDNKAPGLFWVFAPFVAAFGATSAAAFAANMLTTGAFLGLSATVLAKLPISFAARATGVTVAAWTQADVFLLTNQPNAESFMNLFALLALVFWMPGPLTWRRAAAIGLALGFGSLIKQIMLGAAAILAFAVVADRKNGGLRRGAVLLAASLLPWLAVFGFFAASGRAEILWDSVVGYARTYAGSPLLNLARGFGELRFLLPGYFRPFLLLYLVGVWVAFRRRDRSLLPWLVASAAMVVVPGRFYSHYAQLQLPALVLMAALTADEISRAASRVARHALQGVLIVAAGAFFALQAPLWLLSPGELSYKKYGAWFTDVRDIARYLDEIVAPTDAFYAWSVDPGLHLGGSGRGSGRSAVSGVLWCDHVLMSSPLRDTLRSRLASDLQRARPRWLLMDCELCPCPSGIEAVDELALGATSHPLPSGVSSKWRFYRREQPAK